MPSLVDLIDQFHQDNCIWHLSGCIVQDGIDIPLIIADQRNVKPASRCWLFGHQQEHQKQRAVELNGSDPLLWIPFFESPRMRSLSELVLEPVHLILSGCLEVWEPASNPCGPERLRTRVTRPCPIGPGGKPPQVDRPHRTLQTPVSHRTLSSRASDHIGPLNGFDHMHVYMQAKHATISQQYRTYIYLFRSCSAIYTARSHRILVASIFAGKVFDWSTRFAGCVLWNSSISEEVEVWSHLSSTGPLLPIYMQRHFQWWSTTGSTPYSSLWLLTPAHVLYKLWWRHHWYESHKFMREPIWLRFRNLSQNGYTVIL